jgi:type I restriction enzyme S subunit
MNDELPQGWATAQIADVTARVPNIRPEDSPDKEFGYVDISSVDNSRFAITDVKRFKGKDAPSRARRPIQPNDVVFSNVRTYLRNIALVDPDCPAEVCSTGFTVLRPTTAVEPRYLFRYVLTDQFLDRVTPQQTGTHYPATSDRVVMSEQIPLPPLAEQRRIVAKLETLLGKVDACQRRLAKIPVLLKRFRQSVLAAACSGRLTADWREKRTTDCTDDTDKKPSMKSAKSVVKDWPAEDLPELPETWAWGSIGQIFTVETGTTPPKKIAANYSEAPTDCPFFKPTDLDAGPNVREAREWISEQGENFARVLPPLTVSVTSIGATIGKTGFLRVRGATNQQINSILPADGIRPEFTFFYCCSPHFQRRILEASSSTTLPIINKGRFEELEFPLPPLAEQQEIVRRVEAFFALADQLEARFTKAKAHVEKLTPSLLAKAFRGELVPQDPNDEPAAALLERVRRREDSPPRKRQAKGADRRSLASRR